MKLRTTGGAMELIAAGLGAVSVRMSALDIYQSSSRGTLAGVFFSLQSLRSYDLQNVAKYVTSGISFGSAVQAWVISDLSWNGLTAEIQHAKLAARRGTEAHFCRYADDHERSEQQALAASGLAMVPFEGTQRAALLARMQPVIARWVADQTERNRPAAEIVKAFQAAAEGQ